MGDETIDEVHFVQENENLAKDIILKSGNYKAVSGITRVTMKRADNKVLIIENPEVYCKNRTSYVVFGEVVVDNFSQKLALAQEQARQTSTDTYLENSEEDIEMIVEETGFPEDEVIKALDEHGGDVVMTIFALHSRNR
ncbi:nascent polypeptide-associated complex subunit alpha KNAG_0B06740 [Huiozyma naganishii CBS 8797]|uniref:Nascent polypeptide-associated complex subunit beta n=1 Tax=Huiozyma naganishii (strain ATCC MYA-139 / BCRC 22969 / CBS 8797 / KCTC 17520 / NBRC 10181 / NCYC 3082 / Yp74L-3) TaxID=1071383 RepID=J7S456_HUIN7|nr:hypothetical protein KNAG_0B06740 [Kazachstania naganishii CBS 8797]CCK69099.1 hypothetical protein KNAG_0B06740 [Kazachstania naganishii CBS 8797]